jgi:hypothetical protein
VSKLVVGQANDPLEHEADRVADQVMRMPERGVSGASASVMEGGPQERLAGSQAVVGDTPAVVHDVLRSPGQPLEASARAYFEPRFDHSFGDVRIHADTRAAESAKSIHAAAYTVGKDVVFDAGSYNPHAPQGRRLLAHELAHVVQQSHSSAVIQRQPKKDSAPPAQTFPQFQNIDQVVDLILETAVGIPILEIALGVEDPAKERPEVLNARAAFRWSYKRKALPFLPSASAREAFKRYYRGPDERVLNAIDYALKLVTRDNPDLLLAYYRYYAEHDLSSAHFEGRRSEETGETSGGDTEINEDVLRLESNFPTTADISLLASTLIHEYTHGPHGPKSLGVGWVPKDAKAYAVERFFAERMGDTKRVAVIEGLYPSSRTRGIKNYAATRSTTARTGS